MELLKNTTLNKELTQTKESPSRIDIALTKATRWLTTQQNPDGHWCGELESNCTITAEYVMMCQALKIPLSESRRQDIKKHFFSQQKNDGSWGLAWNHPGDVSTTIEVYFALRLLECSTSDPLLEKAQTYILSQGGIEKSRIFTRINLALFGLFPWESIPNIPPETILMPDESPFSIYKLSSWARSTMVPLFIVFHHKPCFSLPNGCSPLNSWLDHLWSNPTKKDVPYRESIVDTLKENGLSLRSFFVATDALALKYENIRSKSSEMPPLVQKTLNSLRDIALKKCENWVLEHQESSGDWGGIFPPMLNGALALYLQGYHINEDSSNPLSRALKAIEAFAWKDAEQGFRIQACVSPVWDTALSLIALSDAKPDEKSSSQFVAARKWILDKQIQSNHGDWRIYNKSNTTGGWSFEYHNTWYPDVDDTAAVLIALLKQDPSSKASESIQKAFEWMISMQNKDGGFAAFDINNNHQYLNKIPFSDMDSLCDPSSPDIAGRVLESLGYLNESKYKEAAEKTLEYLLKTQEPEGSWYGRWGVNYIYGTSNVLCGLKAYGVSSKNSTWSQPIKKAIHFLKNSQNKDGGWGERLESYTDRHLMGKGPSTASQTAWALMGLMTYTSKEDPAILKGIDYLIQNQVSEHGEIATWKELESTGTGFPNHFYIRYHMYRHYFPVMALGRFIHA